MSDPAENAYLVEMERQQAASANEVSPAPVRRTDQPHEGPNVGRLIVTLVPNGTSRPAPHVYLDPVGLFTPGLIGDYTLPISQAIAAAQAKLRQEARRAQREGSDL